MTTSAAPTAETARSGAASTGQSLRTTAALTSKQLHDLRSPLNAVIGFSELLADESSGALSEKQRRYIAFVREAGASMLALLEALDPSGVVQDEIDILVMAGPLQSDRR